MALFRRETLRSLYHRLPAPPHSNYTFRRIDPFPLMVDRAVVSGRRTPPSRCPGASAGSPSISIRESRPTSWPTPMTCT